MNWKNELKRTLGEDKVREDYEHRLLFSKDSSDASAVVPEVVIHPESEEDVSEALRLLYRYGIPLTPRGSGTSLSGGSVPALGGAVMVFDRMNRIKEIDPDDLTAVVESGVITGDLHRAVEKEGMFYPPDPASLESCTLGGNVAENAGGPRALKYGTTKHYVLEITFYSSQGDRITVGKRTKKWVVGYDLPSLMVGSEGTLGVITEIALRLLPRPPKRYTLLLAFGDEVTASRTVSNMIRRGLLPSALEFVDHKCLEAVGEKVAPFLPKGTGSFLLVEYDGFGPEFERQLEITYDVASKNGLLDMFVAEDEVTRRKLWEARRGVLPALESLGFLIRHEDVVVPRSRIPDLVEYTSVVEKETGMRLASFGHAGDGNIHVNILYKKGQEEGVARAVEMVVQKVWELGGTSAGEHGVGILKKKFMKRELDPLAYELLKAIKGTFDPKGILNPHIMFDD
ncbi:MAG: FAD-binding protein [Thermotogae bacterium]|nr:FAD-binding protein [Thermotogota bacterium]